MNTRQITAILKAARAMGVHKLAFNGFEAEFFGGEVAPKQEIPRVDAKEVIKSLLESDQEEPMSHEEMLLRSSPAFDLMQEAKENLDKATQ